MSDDSNRNDDASPDAAEDGGPENFFIDILTGNKETESPKKLLVQKVLLLEENVGTLNDRPISRFHICNGWRYRYWKCRGYLAACVAIARRHGVYVHGRYAPARDIADVASGKVLLGWKGEGLLGFGHGRWEAEDLALKPAVFVRGVDPE